MQLSASLATLLASLSLASAWVNVSLYEHKGYGGNKIITQVIPESYRQCINIQGSDFDYLNKRITSYSIVDGCCMFYREVNCVGSMFSADNTFSQKIEGDNNDDTSSISCSDTCDGLP